MSLINEALKKAQRARSDETGHSAGAAPPADERTHYRDKGHQANTMILIGSGALVLVVLSVVLTILLVNRPEAAPAVASAAVPVGETPMPSQQAGIATNPIPVASAASGFGASTVAAVAPVSGNPPSGLAPVETTTSEAASQPNVAGSIPAATAAGVITLPPIRPQPASVRPATPPVAVTPEPAVTAASIPEPPNSAASAQVTAPAPVPAAEPKLAPDQPDERITAFVESIRVTGIRSSGADSRVLMNERVYRVNDVVERNLNVRLVNAAADSLTFTDARGVTYVKRF